MTLDDIVSVAPCPVEGQDGQVLTCWAIDVWRSDGPYDLRLLVTSDRDPKLARVQINEQVYTAETRAD